MKRWWNARHLGLLLVLPLVLVGLREFARHRPKRPVEPASAAHSGTSTSFAAADVPHFAEPEQARRYFDAMAEGDRRAIALIDDALAKAKEGVADSKYVAQLTQERATRAARLSTSVTARTALAAAPENAGRGQSGTR